MSQFLLLANPDVSRLPEWTQINDAKEDPFFSRIGKILFLDLASPVIATVTVDGKDFDEVFVSAQRDLIGGKSLDDTLLYRLIMAVYDKVDAMALWYGNDYEGLEQVSDIHSVISEIRRGLFEPSIEAYIVFFKDQRA